MEVRFLGNEAGEDEGLNHPGIEHYMSAPYAGIARECGQNSRDAKICDPVRISIRCLEIQVSQIPGFEQLRATIDRCLAEAIKAKDRGEKPRKFFENARRIAGASTIQILEVRDFNTTGLRVGESGTSAFDALVKGTGVSAGKAADSGGSFGIGKFAAFAPSELRTVFYSTVYDGPGGAQTFRFQGKSILISHTDAKGPKRSIGYWGAPGFAPVTKAEQCPEWVRRTERGTSVFAVGFRAAPHWQAQLAESVVQNFFLAIERGEMVFDIEGFEQLTKESLPRFFQDVRVSAAAEAIGRKEDFDLARLLHKCMTDSSASADALKLATGGEIKVRTLTGDGYPKGVAIVRNGMMITDNLAHFGEKFRRFPRCRDFICVVEPADILSSTQFKSMENPSHNDLTTERIPDAVERQRLHAAMIRLGRDIRSAIKDKTTAPSEDQVDITELNEFFGGTDTGDRSGGKLDDPETETVKGRLTTGDPPSQGTAGGAKGGGTTKGKKTGKRKGSLKTGGKTGGGRLLELDDPRNHLVAADATKRRIYFTPKTSGRAVIQIDALGMSDGKDPLQLSVTACADGNGSAAAKSGNIEITLAAGQRTVVDVAFGEKYAGPISVSATAVPDAKP